MLKQLLLNILALFFVAIDGGDVHQENDFAPLLEPKLRKVFYETYDEIPSQFDKVFHIKTSKKAKETDYRIGAMKPWEMFGSGASSNYKTTTTGGTTVATPDPSVQYQTIPPGAENVYVHQEFADGFIVERKFIDDEKYGVIEKMTKDLARAGRAKVETDAATFVGNGFADASESTGDPTKAIYDGEALFSTEHPLLNSTEKVSNLITTKLSIQGLKTASTMMRQMKDEAGKKIGLKPNTLIVTAENEWLARELLNSTHLPGTDFNDVNVMKSKYEIIVWDYLDDIDENLWILMDSNRHDLNWFWRFKPEFGREKDFDTFVQKYKGYMRYSYGASDFRGIIGSTGENNPGTTEETGGDDQTP